MVDPLSLRHCPRNKGKHQCCSQSAPASTPLSSYLPHVVPKTKRLSEAVIFSLVYSPHVRMFTDISVPPLRIFSRETESLHNTHQSIPQSGRHCLICFSCFTLRAFAGGKVEAGEGVARGPGGVSSGVEEGVGGNGKGPDFFGGSGASNRGAKEERG